MNFRNVLYTMACLGIVFLVACTEPVKLLWKASLPGSSLSTPLVTEHFIGVGHEAGIRILEKDGAKRCDFKTSREVIGAPKSDGLLLYFGSMNYVFYAIDTHCVLVWTFDTKDRIRSDPYLDNRYVIISSYDGHVYALDKSHGSLVWQFPASKELVIEEPSVDMISISRDDISSSLFHKLEVGRFISSAPLVHNNMIYIGNEDQYLYALNYEDGSLEARLKTQGAILSSPQVKDSTIYVGSNDGHVYAFSLPFGSERWNFQREDWFVSSARLHENILYIGSHDRTVYALHVKDGNLLWQFSTKGPILSQPAIWGNYLVVTGSSGDGRIYLIERNSGKIHWRYQTATKIESDPVEKQNLLYVSAGDGYLYVFSLKGGF